MLSKNEINNEVDDVAMNQMASGDVYSLIPAVSPVYVKWGNYDSLFTIVKSGKFFPVAITGMSGNGKTLMVEQVCANAKRALIRINISKATTEDDLIGGFRLENGNTVWEDGPVIAAMKAGAILLIDEFDRGSPGEMVCLHSVMEGKPYYIKRINKLVSPTPGFNIIGTANTKGRGSVDGRYIAASVQDDALMERFPVWQDQGYPPREVEADILYTLMTSKGYEIDKKYREFYYIQTLIEWSSNIRTTFLKEGIDDVITTRRLCAVCELYDITKNFDESVKACVSKFDTDTGTAMMTEFQLRRKSEKDIERLIAVEKSTPLQKATIQSGTTLGNSSKMDALTNDPNSLAGFNRRKNDDSNMTAEHMNHF